MTVFFFDPNYSRAPTRLTFATSIFHNIKSHQAPATHRYDRNLHALCVNVVWFFFFVVFNFAKYGRAGVSQRKVEVLKIDELDRSNVRIYGEVNKQFQLFFSIVVVCCRLSYEMTLHWVMMRRNCGNEDGIKLSQTGPHCSGRSNFEWKLNHDNRVRSHTFS